MCASQKAPRGPAGDVGRAGLFGSPLTTPPGRQPALLALDSWAGLRLHPVELIGETRKKFKVRVMKGDFVLPGGRRVRNGDIVQVPKHAICLPQDLLPRGDS